MTLGLVIPLGNLANKWSISEDLVYVTFAGTFIVLTQKMYQGTL